LASHARHFARVRTSSNANSVTSGIVRLQRNAGMHRASRKGLAANANVAGSRRAKSTCPPRTGARRQNYDRSIEAGPAKSLILIGTAGFDASGDVSRRRRAEPGKRSEGAAGAEAQPATP